MGPSKALVAISLILVGVAWLLDQAEAGQGDESPTIPPSTPLIPREVLFGNPDRAALRVSPDGKHLSFLAPVNGVLNVWVAPVDDLGAAKPVTKDTGRGIRIYFWAYTSRHLLYLQDQGGDENWKVYTVDLAGGRAKDLTPFESIPGPDGKPRMLPSGKPMRPKAHIEQVSHRFPDAILIGLNTRDPRYHDLYRVDIRTGDLALVQQNPGFEGFVADDDYHVRFATRTTSDGGMEIFRPVTSAAGSSPGAPDVSGWEPFATIGMEDAMTTHPLGFDKSGQVLYMTDSRGRNTAALTAIDLKSGKVTLLAEDPRADVSEVLEHPTEHTLQAVAFNYTRPEWKVLDPSIQGDLASLRSVLEGDITITSRTLDDRLWTVAAVVDDGPARFYLYDRAAKKAKFLFTNRKDLEGLPLAKMHPEVIKSRDGLDLVSYLTLPVGSDAKKAGRPDRARPMALVVHGGPWARDTWGLNGEDQWLANRGYAVLSVNYRGSTGLGKRFLNAGNREWAGKMHDDLIDAVQWAVREGIADKSRVAILGASYGGYAALVGLTFTPDVFACGVDIVGPSNLVTLLNTIPPYWEPGITMFTTRVGDHRTEEGRRFLDSRSPLSFVDRIRRPLLIGQGANDPRVKQSEADQIVAAMQGRGIPVTYVLYPDEGHGFARPENRLSFNAVVEAFLSRHLGGRFEPVGRDFEGAAITVPTGAEDVPGLRTALQPH
ncbi:MAG TPA: S9 family peptidase [Candidatus Methylomirabilis sp.]|nr:S9 family peptidase [Candidatus Methylomirabilis sp.]